MKELAQVVVDGASAGGLYALVTLGIALVFGVMRLINFAQGQLIMAGAYTAFLFNAQADFVTILVVLVIVTVLALAMERVAFRPVRGADPSTLLVTSFALAYLLQNVAVLWFGRPKSVNMLDQLNEPLTLGGLRTSVADLTVIAITTVLLVALATFLRRTRTGIQIRAASEDFEMARMVGVKADRVIAVAFGISGFLAAVVSIFLVVNIGVVTPTFGVSAVLVAFVATVVGGMGSLVGAVLGAFALGLLGAILQRYLPLQLLPFRDAFLFGLVILILLIKPEGLFVRRSTERLV